MRPVAERPDFRRAGALPRRHSRERFAGTTPVVVPRDQRERARARHRVNVGDAYMRPASFPAPRLIGTRAIISPRQAPAEGRVAPRFANAPRYSAQTGIQKPAGEARREAIPHPESDGRIRVFRPFGPDPDSGPRRNDGRGENRRDAYMRPLRTSLVPIVITRTVAGVVPASRCQTGGSLPIPRKGRYHARHRQNIFAFGKAPDTERGGNAHEA